MRYIQGLLTLKYDIGRDPPFEIIELQEITKEILTNIILNIDI